MPIPNADIVAQAAARPELVGISKFCRPIPEQMMTRSPAEYATPEFHFVGYHTVEPV